jgi:Rrf2 family protein
MFSQKAEYALRAVVWLAEHIDDGPVGNQQIAEGTQVPVTYLAKILQELVRCELVTSRRGAGGGFKLIANPAKLTVLDVVNSVDPIKRYTGCPLKLKSHAKKRCPMHASLDDALGKLEAVLSGTSIANILNDTSRPKPMVESRKRH